MFHSRDGVLWMMCCFGFVPNVTFCISAKKFHLGSSNHKSFCHMASEYPEWIFAYFKQDSRWEFLSNGFLHKHSDQSLPERHVALLKLPLASLINLLLAWSSSLEGWPDLGRVLVVPYIFHFLMTILTVLQGILKVFEIFFTLIPWSVPFHNFIPEVFWNESSLVLHGCVFAVKCTTQQRKPTETADFILK